MAGVPIHLRVAVTGRGSQARRVIKAHGEHPSLNVTESCDVLMVPRRGTARSFVFIIPPRWGQAVLPMDGSYSRKPTRTFLAARGLQSSLHHGTLGCVNRSTRKSREVIFLLYLALVRPLLESCVQFWVPHFKADMDRLKGVQ